MNKIIPIIFALILIFSGLYVMAAPYLPKEPGMQYEQTLEATEQPKVNPGALGMVLAAGGILVLMMAFRR